MIALLAAAVEAKTETGFLNRTVTVKGTTHKFQVYLPLNYNKSQKWPVVLFLHGAGERGDNGLAQTDTGIGKALRLFPDRYPAVVVMPQCAKDKWWTMPEMQDMALAALEQTVKEFKGDRTRLYLTGLSMGGYGTFGLGAKYPGQFAAMAAICGGVRLPNVRAVSQFPQPSGDDPYGDTAKKIGKTPMWIFHGAADAVVPVTESQKMVAALKAVGAEPKYSEYPGVNHNSWDRAYAEVEFPKWFFAQKLDKPAAKFPVALK
jgi:predicted peptidase